MSPKTAPLSPTAELAAPMKLLMGESDRGCILIGAALLDEHLAEAIAGRLATPKEAKELVGGYDAPVGDFKARIILARGLGVISAQERSCLDSLRDMRNKAAHFDRTRHGFDVSFAQPSLQDQVASFFTSAGGVLDDIPDRQRRARIGFEMFVAEMAIMLRVRTRTTERLPELADRPAVYAPMVKVFEEMFAEREAAGLGPPENMKGALLESPTTASSCSPFTRGETPSWSGTGSPW